MKKFYKKFIVPVLAVILWLILMLLPYCIARPIVNWIEMKTGRQEVDGNDVRRY